MPTRHLETGRLGMPTTAVLLGHVRHVHAVIGGAQAEHVIIAIVIGATILLL